MADFLQLSGKTIVVFGVANRKSIAFHIGKTLTECGADVIYVVRTEDRKKSVSRLVGDSPVLVCDVGDEAEIQAVVGQVAELRDEVYGIVHSIAFAAYDEAGIRPFHETTKSQLLKTFDISCFSLLAICNAFKELLVSNGSVVTISISTTRMASENYGFMAPIKAALDSSLAFLAKSFSNFSEVRFNAVAPGLLKTSASAGIPGYVDSYLFAEQVIPRGKAVQTAEAANVACFLLSPRSSGVQAQQVIVDAGMSINYFDKDVVEKVMNSDQ